MSYLVLARKWRPQAFADMTGQEHIVRTLANAIAQGRVAHAFLFCGPRGVGKTTAARLLARALNCEQGPTANPCGSCQACREIAAGTSVDVAEIDGASNNGVEDVRQIRERVGYLPQRDRHKIYIIDEVHMLTNAAFNALLKTLEEPPPHVKFIFATTEPHKLPDTILSRCQRHNFRRIAASKMIDRIRQIVGAEGAHFSEQALSMVVRQAEGGMRDALSLLDMILSACGNDPTDEEVAEALGTVDRTAVHELCRALLTRDAKPILTKVEELHQRGIDFRRLAEELALYLRHILVARSVGEAPTDLADFERKGITELARDADPTHLTRLFEMLQGSIWEISRAAQPRLAMEVALLKGVHLAPGAPVAELLARVEALSQKLGTLPPTSSPPVAEGGRPAPQPFRAPEAVATAPVSPDSPLSAPSSTTEPPTSLRPLIAELRAKKSELLASALANALLLSTEGGVLRLGFVPSAGLFRRQVEKGLEELKPLVARLLGGLTGIQLESVNEAPASGTAPHTTSGPVSVAEEERAEARAREDRLKRESREAPEVLAAMKILGAKVENIRPLDVGGPDDEAMDQFNLQDDE